MGWIVGIIVVLIVLYFALQYWYITLPLVAIAIVIYFVNEERKKRETEDEARRTEEARRREEEFARNKRYREEQDRCQKELITICENSIKSFESMPRKLDGAEKNLDQAEWQFKARAFAPFWDSIEMSARWLGQFRESVQEIHDYSSRYKQLIGTYALAPPPFPIARQSISKLEAGTDTSKRMEAIVWIAQRDFQFATIYEQRKTNQILIAGFANLAQALGQMTSRITSSIGELSDSVGALYDSSRAIHERQGEILEATIESRRDSSALASEQAQRAEKALEMLDNIQRGRKPPF